MKGGTVERGYGAEFQELRRYWQPHVDAGQVACWRCGRFIVPGSPWDLGHDDHDRSVIRGPEHARCNRSAAAKLGNARRPKGRQGKGDWARHRRQQRVCVICAALFVPSYQDQRTCSRTCGWQMRRGLARSSRW